MRTEVTTTYLEMLDPTWLRPALHSPISIEINPVKLPCPELSRFFYTAVGGDWYWLDRLDWTYDDWLTYLDRPQLETWIATASTIPAGYFELEQQPQATIELIYFGLLPQFIGQGIGSYCLTAAIQRAWEMNASRVWLHTCTLDHPNALETYQRRGFRIYNTDITYEDLPAKAPGPWPNAKG